MISPPSSSKQLSGDNCLQELRSIVSKKLCLFVTIVKYFNWQTLCLLISKTIYLFTVYKLNGVAVGNQNM